MAIKVTLKSAPRANALVGLDRSQIPIVWFGGRWWSARPIVTLVHAAIRRGWLSHEVKRGMHAP